MGLLLASWWVGPGLWVSICVTRGSGGQGWVPSANKLQRVLQNGVCQCWYSCARTSSPNGCPKGLLLQGDPSCLLSLQEALQAQQVGLTQAPLKGLPLCFSCEVLCAHLRVESLIPVALSSPIHKPCWFSKPDVWGLIFPVQDLRAAEPDVELGPLVPWGGLLQL